MRPLPLIFLILAATLSFATLSTSRTLHAPVVQVLEN